MYKKSLFNSTDTPSMPPLQQKEAISKQIFPQHSTVVFDQPPLVNFDSRKIAQTDLTKNALLLWKKSAVVFVLQTDSCFGFVLPRNCAMTFNSHSSFTLKSTIVKGQNWSLLGAEKLAYGKHHIPVWDYVLVPVLNWPMWNLNIRPKDLLPGEHCNMP